MSQMRKKRKLRGRAAAAEALAAEHELPEVQEALEGEALARAAEAADVEIDDDADGEADEVALADDGAEAEAGSAEADDAAEEVAAEAAVDADEIPVFDLKRTVESLVFATDKPITAAQIAQLIGGAAERKAVAAALAELAEDYRERGIVLHDVAGGYQFRTHPASSAYVQRLIAGKPVRLSRAQLDTLAIIAYRQPITRPEIDEIRGVDSGGTLKVLLDRHLIRVLGKKEEPGRPLLYGTTKDFLEFFNLSDLRELPTLREFHELTEDSVREAQRLGVDLGPQSGAEAAQAAAESEADADGQQAAAEPGEAGAVTADDEAVAAGAGDDDDGDAVAAADASDAVAAAEDSDIDEVEAAAGDAGDEVAAADADDADEAAEAADADDEVATAGDSDGAAEVAAAGDSATGDEVEAADAGDEPESDAEEPRADAAEVAPPPEPPETEEPESGSTSL